MQVLVLAIAGSATFIGSTVASTTLEEGRPIVSKKPNFQSNKTTSITKVGSANNLSRLFLMIMPDFHGGKWTPYIGTYQKFIPQNLLPQSSQPLMVANGRLLPFAQLTLSFRRVKRQGLVSSWVFLLLCFFVADL